MDFEFLGNFCMEEEHVVCPYDQSELQRSTGNKDLEKQCSE